MQTKLEHQPRFSTPLKIRGDAGLRTTEKDMPSPEDKQVTQQGSGKIKKRVWTEEEDNMLMMVVGMFGAKAWSEVAKHFKDRGGKQCRERWHNHLREGVTKNSWSDEEDWILTLGVMAFGNKWSTIAKYLPCRPHNTIKNHWNCKMKPKKEVYLNRISEILEVFEEMDLSETEKHLLRLVASRQEATAFEEDSCSSLQIELCRKALSEFLKVQRLAEAFVLF